MSELAIWKRLCGKAVQLCGSQDAFRKEANVLKRLVKQFGSSEAERMLAGARLLGWTSLRSLGSKDGLGRRWALAKFWEQENHTPTKLPERVRAILRSLGDP